MNLYDSLPDAVATVFGAEALADHSYDVLTVDVPAGSWIASLEIARDKLGCTYFDWLSAVDEPGTGFRVCAHVVSLENHRVRRLLLRTTVPHSAPSLPSAVAIYAGAEWHERETHEMFGVVFTDHPHLVPLLLPENFEGHPLRKDFVLAARVAKAWPGAKEPGEAHDPDAPKRRQMLPPGVPDPNDWGPMKGQLPPAPARPARTARTPRAAAAGAPAAEAPPRPARRTRSASDGSASQAVTPTEPGTGGAPQADAPARPEGQAVRGRTVAPGRRPAPRSADAPWHNPQPAFTEPGPDQAQDQAQGPDQAQDQAPDQAPDPEPAPGADPGPKGGPRTAPGAGPHSDRGPDSDRGPESAPTGTPESESDPNGGDA
ncbi:NADH-quinone oxidoreductase subunit C [Streptomyces sp. NPDC059389]|uniref:NADH-quinone oxidoreductase subunit C n=1 Tax=Streptomyces sp. NPDC059389 TaxID=3346818 RepID=UPI0036B7BBFF